MVSAVPPVLPALEPPLVPTKLGKSTVCEWFPDVLAVPLIVWLWFPAPPVYVVLAIPPPSESDIAAPEPSASRTVMLCEWSPLVDVLPLRK